MVSSSTSPVCQIAWVITGCSRKLLALTWTDCGEAGIPAGVVGAALSAHVPVEVIEYVPLAEADDVSCWNELANTEKALPAKRGEPWGRQRRPQPEPLRHKPHAVLRQALVTD
jgi:hypothetical protein